MTVEEQIKSCLQNINFTYHWRKRLQSRMRIPEYNAKIDIITSVLFRKIYYSSKYQRYKVVWRLWTYVLSPKLRVITVITEWLRYEEEKIFIPLKIKQLRYITRKVWFII